MDKLAILCNYGEKGYASVRRTLQALWRHDLVLGYPQTLIIYVLYTLVVFNFPVFIYIHEVTESWMFVMGAIVFYGAFLMAAFSLFFYKYTFKVLGILWLMANAGTLYFMQTYRVVVDDSMLINVLETDTREVLELLNYHYVFYMIFLAVLPACILGKLRIQYATWPRILWQRLVITGGGLLVMLLVVFANYGEAISFGRSERGLRYRLIPYNYMSAIYKILEQRYVKYTPQPFEQLGELAKLTADLNHNGKKNLLVLVVGEAARAQNFSLQGYARDTNAPLADQDILYFNNVSSCGTSTAVSVPCMFSSLPRTEFTVEDKNNRENLLDILQDLGFYVTWLDNNSSCKGVCERLPDNQNFTQNIKATTPYCSSNECHDEILIQGLKTRIAGLTAQNNVIVLHQKGSHGPAYYLRYPEKFQRFQPICQSEYFSKCEPDTIVNSYDNTIYYTSHVLNQAIELLQSEAQDYNTMLLYISDHGQSLGENGLYLHGAPYRLAPEEQKHIPMLLWFSPDFVENFRLDLQQLQSKLSTVLSHDNLFHSVLGLFSVVAPYYDESLDIFSDCRR